MSAVIYGKHPAYGDFLGHGLPHAELHVFDRWLEAVLPKLRDGLGDQWEAAWRAAPALRFWAGPDIIGAPLAGVMLASRDRVGRRYPLIFALTGVVSPPPLHPAFDHGPYEAMLGHILAFEAPPDGAKGAVRLIEGMALPELAGAPFEEGQDGVLWASRADGNLGQLFQDARGADADKAQLGRSHWWHPATEVRQAGWLAVNGLPDADALRWLLTDRVVASEAAPPPPSPPHETAPAAEGAAPDE
ncbi:MAG: type VI secretion system-associated protein TagF [Pseudomonadota bacterium]